MRTRRNELERDAAAGRLVCARAHALLHGQVRTSDEGAGWVRPWRFTERQLRVLGSCQAWHPGLYRQMARTTAGITLEFETDASEVALELLVDAEPAGTRAVMAEVDAWCASQGLADCADRLAVEVDERTWTLPLPERGEWLVSLTLDDPADRPLPDVLQLPGLGGTHAVRVHLPALRGCAVRMAWSNGTVLVPRAARPTLLVLGDSLAQGFAVGSPAAGWPHRLARRLGLDPVNQGLGGQVFQPGSLADMGALPTPAAIVVAYGANYRYERCDERQTATGVRAYLAEVARLWPEVATWVATPTWHDEQASPSHARSCWQGVPAMIAANVAAHDEMRLVDGATLLDAAAGLLADGYEHYNAAGAAQVATRLYVCMRSSASLADEELRDRALSALAERSASALTVREAVRRRRARVLVAEPGCVLARVPGAEQLLWATDAELADAALATQGVSSVVDLRTPGLSSQLADRWGLTHVEPYHVAVYEGTRPLPADGDHLIRTLDESYLATVMERYEHAAWLDEAQVRKRLAEGRFLGGFVGDELVGFVGEHEVGAIGLLEVFRGHRRQGWARALEVAQINRVLERGDVAWLQVYPKNRTSLRLQRSLGLTVTPATEQCYLSRPGGAFQK